MHEFTALSHLTKRKTLEIKFALKNALSSKKEKR